MSYIGKLSELLFGKRRLQPRFDGSRQSGVPETHYCHSIDGKVCSCGKQPNSSGQSNQSKENQR